MTIHEIKSCDYSALIACPALCSCVALCLFQLAEVEREKSRTPSAIVVAAKIDPLLVGPPLAYCLAALLA